MDGNCSGSDNWRVEQPTGKPTKAYQKLIGESLFWGVEPTPLGLLIMKVDRELLTKELGIKFWL